MKKILISVSIIAAVAAVVVGATTAFFSDTETSTGNTFTAGSIDLKVDNTCYLNGVQVSECTWGETDLRNEKFFNFSDLKPGDHGEDTLSLHVYDNDAWGKMTITGVADIGDTCVDPETEAVNDDDCFGEDVGIDEDDGELRENTRFSFWLDQGAIPGFQNKVDDPTEGDNVWQSATEPMFYGYAIGADGIIEMGDESHNLWEALAAVRAGTSACSGTPVDGHNSYGLCHGLAEDGRLVGSATYYFGMAWKIPYDVGNEAQSDAFSGNLKFEAVQHRNNPGHNF